MDVIIWVDVMPVSMQNLLGNVTNGGSSFVSEDQFSAAFASRSQPGIVLSVCIMHCDHFLAYAFVAVILY